MEKLQIAGLFFLAGNSREARRVQKSDNQTKTPGIECRAFSIHLLQNKN